MKLSLAFLLLSTLVLPSAVGCAGGSDEDTEPNVGAESDDLSITGPRPAPRCVKLDEKKGSPAGGPQSEAFWHQELTVTNDCDTAQTVGYDVPLAKDPPCFTVPAKSVHKDVLQGPLQVLYVRKLKSC